MNDRHDPLDERLAQSLERQAGRVPSGYDLTDAAMKQASRIRSRRRAGAIVASIAVIAVALPVGWGLVEGDDKRGMDNEVVTTTSPSPSDSTSPSATPSTTPSVTPSKSPVAPPPTNPNPNSSPSKSSSPPPVKPTTVRLDFDDLERGPAPQLPYLYDGKIHEGGETREPAANDRLIAVFEGGQIVYATDPELGTTDLVLIRTNGQRVRLTETGEGDQLPEFAGLSKNRTKMAWSVTTSSGSSESTVLSYAEARTGEVINTTTVQASRRAAGFVGEEVAVANWEDGAFLWRGTTDNLAPWGSTRTAYRTAPPVGLVSVGRPSTDPDTMACGAVIESFNPGDDLWRSCELKIDKFSPTGAYGSATHPMTDGLGPNQITLVESRTGKPRTTIETPDSGHLGELVWESTGAVLATAYVDGRWAIVRCTVAGECELVTSPVEGIPDDSPLDLVDRL
jgi:hypothetical protein